MSPPSCSCENEKLDRGVYFVEQRRAIAFVLSALIVSHILLQIHTNRKYVSEGRLQLLQSVPDYQQVALRPRSSFH